MLATKQGLKNALELLGPNGEYWAKGSGEYGNLPDGFRCAMTACGQILDANSTSHEIYALFVNMRHALFTVLKTFDYPYNNVVRFNDAPETAFADVKLLFERAIEAA